MARLSRSADSAKKPSHTWRNRLLVAVVSAPLVFGTVTGADAIIHHGDEQQAMSQASERAEFWQAVAGNSHAKISIPARALSGIANDLIGPIDSNATELPAEVDSYFVRSNAAYGGITSALGVDPFDNNGCYECGKLTDDFKANLLLVKQGQVQILVEQSHVAMTPPIHTLTPFGWSVWLTIAIVLAAALAIAAGDYLLARGLNRRRHAVLVKQYPREMEQIEAANRALELPIPDGYDASGELDYIRTTRDKLLQQVRRPASENTEQQIRVDRYRTRLSETVSNLQDGVSANEEGRRAAGL